MEPTRAVRFAEGLVRPEEMTPGEQAIEALVRKSVHRPARLEPADLEPLVASMGLSGALEIVSILGSFHYITRLTDLVGIRAWLQSPRERSRRLRSLGHRFHTSLVRWGMDFANLRVEIDVAAELAEIERLRDDPTPDGYRLMFEAPSLAAYTRAMMSGLESLDRDLLDRVSRVVASSLPGDAETVTGDSPLPDDPFDALVTTGTRHAHRVTAEQVDRVRRAYGWDDARLSDLFYAISARHNLELFDRLLAGTPRAPGACR